MIQITNEEILEIGAKYGLTNEVIGYSDFEKLLIHFGTQMFIQGYNTGHKAARDHIFLETCNCWEA